MEAKQYFNKSITFLIKGRISVRSYKPHPLSDEIKDKLIIYSTQIKGPFNAKVRFKVVDSRTVLDSGNIKLGTYGVIRGASSFIVSAVEKGNFYLEELGYEFEELILYATSLGVATCWLGGTFKKGEFSKAIDLKENELLPIVSPIGYGNEEINILDVMIRLAAGSKKRKSFGEVFFEESFNNKLNESHLGLYSTVLEMVRLAPSSSNTQPWRILKEQDKFHFYIYHAKGYSDILSYDIQRIDIGIAMCHFELTAKELGLNGSWKSYEPSLENVPENTEYIISWFIIN